MSGCLGSITLFIIVAVIGEIVGFVSSATGLAINNLTNTDWVILLPVASFAIGYFWAKNKEIEVMNMNKIFSVTFVKSQFLLVLITTSILFFSSSCNLQGNNNPLVFCAYRDEDGDGIREESISIFSLDTDSGKVSIQQIAQSDSLFQPAVVSPDGKHVAYINDGALYTVEVTGGEPKELAQVDEISSLILWSKNGEFLAFQSGTIQVTLFNPPFPAWKIVSADGSGESKISALNFIPGAYKNYAKMYSPNGDLFVIKYPDSSNLYINRIGKDDVGTINVAEIPGNYDFIEWSPDGKQILLWVREDHDLRSETDFSKILLHSSKATIYIVNADGSNLIQVTALGEVASYFAPAWSPNGNRIIYGSWLEDIDEDGIAEFEHEFSTLFSINKDGSNRTKLLDETYDVTCVDW